MQVREYLIHPRRCAGDRNVGIGFIDFQEIRFARARSDSYDEGETLREPLRRCVIL